MNARKNIARILSALVTLLSIALASSAQVQVAPMTLIRAQFTTSTGVPVAAGCVNFFATGTSTPQAIYSDSTGTFQLANPLTLDAAGEASVWMSNTAYDIVLNTGVPNTACSVSLGTQLWRENNKNPFAIINGGSNYIIASGTVDPGSPTPGELAYRSDIPCFRGFTTIWDCFVELTLTQTLSNKTLASPAMTGTVTGGATYSSPNLTTPSINGTTISGPPATYLVLSNDITTGTTTNTLTKMLGATAIISATTDTGGVVGITVSGAGKSGNATIQQNGSVSCVFDGSTTAGDYVQISSTVVGNCHDAGGAFPVNGAQIIGRAQLTAAGAGTYAMLFFGPEFRPSAASAAASANQIGLSGNIGATTLLTPAGNGYYRISCYTVVTQAATSSSTLPSCQFNFTDADTGTAENGFQMLGTNTSNTVGTTGVPGAASPNYPFFAKGGAVIQYLTAGYASSGATSMQYAIHVRLEGPF